MNKHVLFKPFLTASLVLFALAGSTMAEVWLPAIIGDNMVLQRDVKTKIWGKARPGEKIAVSIAAVKVSAIADASGHWRVELPPLKTGAATEMTVAGDKKIVIKNILIGDVWLGSGQSNMSFGKQSSDAADDPADYPKIRLFLVDSKVSLQPVDDVSGKWVVCNPFYAKSFSAVMFIFGDEYHRATKIPVGLIQSAVGGSCIETWCSRGMYESDPQLKPVLDAWDKKSKPKEVAAPDKVFCFRDLPKDYSVEVRTVPSPCYNAMIAPLVNFAIKGAIWYQGEGNLDKPDLYYVQLTGMIRDWRKNWGSDFIFLVVEIPGYGTYDANEKRMSSFRAVQKRAALATPNTELIVAMDTGMTRTQQPRDKQHPPDKKKIGQRAALIARALGNGERELVYKGPVYDSMKVEGGDIRLTFNNLGGGLAAGADGKAGKVTGFSIAGPDKKYFWTDARLDGNTVVVSRGNNGLPETLRYGYSGITDANLYNKQGLPVSAFKVEQETSSATARRSP